MIFLGFYFNIAGDVLFLKENNKGFSYVCILGEGLGYDYIISCSFILLCGNDFCSGCAYKYEVS